MEALNFINLEPPLSPDDSGDPTTNRWSTERGENIMSWAELTEWVGLRGGAIGVMSNRRTCG